MRGLIARIRRKAYRPPPLYKKFDGLVYSFADTFEEHDEAGEYFRQWYDPIEVLHRIRKREIFSGLGAEFNLYLRNRSGVGAVLPKRPQGQQAEAPEAGG